MGWWVMHEVWGGHATRGQWGWSDKRGLAGIAAGRRPHSGHGRAVQRCLGCRGAYGHGLGGEVIRFGMRVTGRYIQGG